MNLRSQVCSLASCPGFSSSPQPANQLATLPNGRRFFHLRFLFEAQASPQLRAGVRAGEIAAPGPSIQIELGFNMPAQLFLVLSDRVLRSSASPDSAHHVSEQGQISQRTPSFKISFLKRVESGYSFLVVCS